MSDEDKRAFAELCRLFRVTLHVAPTEPRCENCGEVVKP